MAARSAAGSLGACDGVEVVEEALLRFERRFPLLVVTPPPPRLPTLTGSPDPFAADLVVSSGQVRLHNRLLDRFCCQFDSAVLRFYITKFLRFSKNPRYFSKKYVFSRLVYQTIGQSL